MGTEMILGVVIVSPVALSAAALLWAPDEWLHAFVILARSLARSMLRGRRNGLLSRHQLL